MHYFDVWTEEHCGGDVELVDSGEDLANEQPLLLPGAAASSSGGRRPSPRLTERSRDGRDRRARRRSFTNPCHI